MGFKYDICGLKQQKLLKQTNESIWHKFEKKENIKKAL